MTMWMLHNAKRNIFAVAFTSERCSMTQHPPVTYRSSRESKRIAYRFISTA